MMFIGAKFRKYFIGPVLYLNKDVPTVAFFKCLAPLIFVFLRFANFLIKCVQFNIRSQLCFFSFSTSHPLVPVFINLYKHCII